MTKQISPRILHILIVDPNNSFTGGEVSDRIDEPPFRIDRFDFRIGIRKNDSPVHGEFLFVVAFVVISIHHNIVTEVILAAAKFEIGHR